MKERKPIKNVQPLEILVDDQILVKCPFCPKTDTTRNRSLLKEHIRIHTGETPFKCKYSEVKFMLKSQLQSHIESYHKKKKQNCPLCRQKFYEADELHAHRLTCARRRTFQCHLCGFTMKRLYMHKVAEHMVRHTEIPRFKCHHCNEKFIRRCGLDSHQQKEHLDAMPFACTNCERRFTLKKTWEKHELHCLTHRRFQCHMCHYTRLELNLETLQLHMRKHTGEKPHQCHLCNKYFPRKEALSDHLQRHRDVYNFQCSKCHRRHLKKEDHDKHEQICKRRRYECHLCGFTKFGISFHKFSRHMACHTGIRSVKCHECSESFSNFFIMAEHVHRNHPKLVATLCPNCCHRFSTRKERDTHQSQCFKSRFECHICKKWQLNEARLKIHITQKHAGAQLFKCELCPKEYQKKINLTNHIKSHTKIGLVKCQYCSKKFNDMKYKKKHEHQCKKVYECYLCKQTFPSFRILNGTHMKTHLGAKPYDCRHCPRSSGSVRCYDLHVINAHLHLYKFQCNVCHGLVLKRKDFLIHQKSCMKGIRQSQGVIYFKCSLCDKGLARLPELRKHILSGECKNHPRRSRR